MSGRRNSFFQSSATKYGFAPEAFDPGSVPGIADDFSDPEGIEAFANALQAPEFHSAADELSSPSSASFTTIRSPRLISEDPHDETNTLASASGNAVSPAFRQTLSLTQQPPFFISAQNDWAPVHEKVKKSQRRKRRAAPVHSLLGERTKDETREGYLYNLLKWPLLLGVSGILALEWICYLFTRLYIYLYEQTVAWRGKRATLRRNMRTTNNYKDWVIAAKELDSFLGRQDWKEENEYAYYDSKTIRRVWDHMRKLRHKAESLEKSKGSETGKAKPVEELRVLAEACIKSNFVGVEGPRLYSQTYYGTKNLVQNYIDECKCHAWVAAKVRNSLANSKNCSGEDDQVPDEHQTAPE